MSNINFIKKENLVLAKDYLIAFLRWTVLSAIVGIIGGIIGSVFSKTIEFMASVRSNNAWLIFLMPLGGLAIAGIYQVLKVRGYDTNTVFESSRCEKKVPVLLAPAIFLGSAITHLVGGSAGKEGAALQLGGSIASALGMALNLSTERRHIMIMCGMSAFFSSVLGTPLCASIFAIEVISVGYLYSAAVFPCISSSLVAYYISNLFGVTHERFRVGYIPSVNFILVLKIIAISVIGAVVSVLFCKVMHLTSEIFQECFKNSYLRIFVGGIFLIALTIIVGNGQYNGSGGKYISTIFYSERVDPEAFLLKIIFTAITIGAGYKGGEIVPTFFVGASLGGTLALLFDIPIPFGAALGISALFCGVTNCPVATVFLSLELFGSSGLLFYALSAAISFLLSGYSSLYTGQKIVFTKVDNMVVDKNI